VRSSAAAEKGGEGMALKILTRAEDIPDGEDNLESQAHTKWKRAIYSNSVLGGFDYFVKVNVTHEGFCTIPAMSSKRFLKQN